MIALPSAVRVAPAVSRDANRGGSVIALTAGDAETQQSQSDLDEPCETGERSEPCDSANHPLRAFRRPCGAPQSKPFVV